MAQYREGLVIRGLRFFGKQFVGGEANPLVIRWILFRCKAWGIYIHKFCRSDYDRALHDHPWPFVSIILWGGYYEVHDQTTDGKQVCVYRKPGSILLRPAEWRHRVVLDKPSWNLIIVGRRCRTWGFFTTKGWCWWRRYNYQTALCEDDVLWTEGKD